MDFHGLMRRRWRTTYSELPTLVAVTVTTTVLPGATESAEEKDLFALCCVASTVPGPTRPTMPIDEAQCRKNPQQRQY